MLKYSLGYRIFGRLQSVTSEFIGNIFRSLEVSKSRVPYFMKFILEKISFWKCKRTKSWRLPKIFLLKMLTKQRASLKRGRYCLVITVIQFIIDFQLFWKPIFCRHVLTPNLIGRTCWTNSRRTKMEIKSHVFDY